MTFGQDVVLQNGKHDDECQTYFRIVFWRWINKLKFNSHVVVGLGKTGNYLKQASKYIRET